MKNLFKSLTENLIKEKKVEVKETVHNEPVISSDNSKEEDIEQLMETMEKCLKTADSQPQDLTQETANIKEENRKFYSFDTVLQKYPDSAFYFILGGRSIGKSFNAKMKIIDDFLLNDKESIWLRRYDAQLEKRYQFFDDIMASGLYPNLEFKVRGYRGYVKHVDDENYNYNKPIIHFVPLSTSDSNEKGQSYPLVNKIYFDEFVEPSDSRYIAREFFKLNEFILTVQRDRVGDNDLKVFLMANSLSYVNTYFTNFKIKIKPGVQFQAFNKDLVVVELCETSQELKKQLTSSPFARALEGTAYYDYAYNNQTLNDNTSFILEKRPSNSKMKLLGCIIYEGQYQNFWYVPNKDKDIIYVDKVGKALDKQTYALLKEDKKKEYGNIFTLKNTSFYKQLKKMYQSNNIRFKDIEMYQIFNQYINKI